MNALFGTTCVAAVALGTAYFAPQATRYLALPGVIGRVRRSRALLLTFDDGPSERLTQAVLDLLRRHDATATFFLLGKNASAHADIVDRAVSDGHCIGSHGFSHVNSWKATPRAIRVDIDEGFKAVEKWVPPNGLYRPPYGKLSLPAWLALRRRGSGLAWWTIDSGDTHAEVPTPQRIAERLARAGGGIVLLHDFDRSAPRMDYVLRTTDLLLRTAKQEGLHTCGYNDLFNCDDRLPGRLSHSSTGQSGSTGSER